MLLAWRSNCLFWRIEIFGQKFVTVDLRQYTMHSMTIMDVYCVVWKISCGLQVRLSNLFLGQHHLMFRSSYVSNIKQLTHVWENMARSTISVQYDDILHALCSQRTPDGILQKCSFNFQWMNKWKSSRKKTNERVANMLRMRRFRSFQLEPTEEVLTNHQKNTRQFDLYSFRVSLEEKKNQLNQR